MKTGDTVTVTGVVEGQERNRDGVLVTIRIPDKVDHPEPAAAEPRHRKAEKR